MARDPKPFDLLAAFGRYGQEHKVPLNQRSSLDAFGGHVARAVDQALADSALLHGQRVEAMFEAMLVSLGTFTLLKGEDSGRVFPPDLFRAPDFRVVLRNGAQWLIEVKNVYEKQPFRQRRKVMTRDYRDSLESYAAATGAELKLAVFWARWSMWTLVTPSRFLDGRGDVVLDMMTAAKGNELSALGDLTIGTRSPLKLRLTMDPARTGLIGDDGLVTAVIGQTAIYAAGTELSDPTEREIAWILMQHGEWACGDEVPVVEGNHLVAIDFTWEPPESANQGFEMIGTLSRMFSRYYAGMTVRDGEVVQLQAPLRPGWFEALIRPDYKSKALPLWRFELQPSYIEPSEAP